ncbi:MAG: S-adenosyl-L-methionine-dependent methyltransferase [Benjaminiella poitrasii]|nr:MAG: S-adenosyl-L-methionine-dependent methyltransferase [Benjaminiella poitrasii]
MSLRRTTKPERKSSSSRRRSWFNTTNLFTMFSSAPPSPEYAKREEEAELRDSHLRQRSQSLTPIDKSTIPNSSSSAVTRPNMIKTANAITTTNKSTFSNILSRATKRKHKRKESTQTQDSYSTMFDDTITHSRRSSSKSDAITLSDKDLSQNLYQKFCYNNSQQQQQQQPRQLLKSDEEEADRIQLKNDLVKLAFEGEFSLPFDYNDLLDGRILDVGCGPGAWCIDLSTRYPHIDVVGVDSNDMFPSECNLPKNCQLIVSNVLNGFKEFADASFDVIHIRFMVLSFTITQYPQVIKDCWRLLKPGGYIEILETDLIVCSTGPVTQKLNSEMLEVATNRRLNPREQVSNLGSLIPSGAINRQTKYRSIPIGIWGGRIGVLCRDDMIHMLTKFQPAVQDYYGKPQETQSFNRDIGIAMKEMEQFKSFTNYYFCTAQKPYSQSSSSSSMRRHYVSPHNPKSF